ncbi:multidrug effflux MFS transporter [Pigmentiphaga litoralis]|uniref:multidrug effflux MFS transporter n=1 Tax=Pigmentiphaga litoralis TaxID=516702 RepID=UPI003B43200B
MPDTPPLPASRATLNPATTAFILFLGALAALPPLSIDMGLPGLGQVQESLNATANQATMTLSLFLLGFAIAPLVLGPLADRFGRRPILLWGVAVFTVAGLGCAMAPSIGSLLGFRVLQGIGAGAGAMLPVVIVRDLFTGAQARARMSYVTLVLGIGPIIAPALGAGIMALSGWREIYGALSVAGAIIFVVAFWSFGESAKPGQRSSLRPRDILRNYRNVLSHRIFLDFALVNGLTFAAMFAYISGSPLVLMANMGLSTGAYSVIFAITAGAMVVGSSVNGWAATREMNPKMLFRTAMALLVLSPLLLVVLTLTGSLTVPVLVPLIAVTTFSLGIVMPNSTHGALQPMGRTAGVASAVLRAIQMACGAAASGLVASLYDGKSAIAMTGTMLLCAAGAAIVYLWMLKPALAKAAAAA